MSKKLKAFTIVELTVAMLISSIVIGIGYYVFTLFNHQVFSYQVRSVSVNEYLVFKKALQKDLEQADAVESSQPDQVTMHRLNQPKEITYDFYKNYIVRTNDASTDSFRLKYDSCRAEAINDSSKLVSRFRVACTIDGVQINPVFSKQYTACQLMWQEHNHE